MGNNGAVRGGVGHAGEDEALAHLVVIQEGLVGLVDRPGLNLAGARRAGSGTAGVREINSCAIFFKEKNGMRVIFLLKDRKGLDHSTHPGACPTTIQNLSKQASKQTNRKLTSLLSGVEDVGIIGAFDDLFARGGLQGDLVGHDLEAADRAGLKKSIRAKRR